MTLNDCEIENRVFSEFFAIAGCDAHLKQDRRNGSGRPTGCRTNNLTSKNFYVHIISIFENVSWF